MKICLINPSNEHELIGNDPTIVKETQGVYPHLGLLYLAAVAEEEGHEVEIVDIPAGDTEIPKADLYGITITTFTLIDALEVWKRLPEGASVVVGGPHPTIFPQETLDLFKADYVVVGEGEATFKKLLHYIKRGKAFKGIWKNESFIERLDDLPFPARRLTKFEKYYSSIAKHSPTTTAITSRGCPYQCTYCDRPALGKKFRFASARYVVDEMLEIESLGIKEIFYYDDTFTVNRQRVMDICSEKLHRGIKIGWDIRARVDTVDYELLKKCKEAGLQRIHLGIESASESLRKVIKKNITQEQIENAFKWCRELKIETLAYFMVGIPGETEKDVEENIKLFRKIKPDFAQCTILTPFPATKIYCGSEWEGYAKNPSVDFRPPVMMDRATCERRLKKMYHAFYLNHRFIWRRLREINSWSKFKVYLKGGLGLLRMCFTF